MEQSSTRSFSIYKSLALLYIKSFFNLPQKNQSGVKSSKKQIFKMIGIAFLAVFLLADFGFIFFTVIDAMYKPLAQMGMEYMLVINVVVICTAMTLIVGFMTSLSTYYLNDMELQLLSLPIPSKSFLSAKFSAVYIYEALTSFVFMMVMMIVFAINGKASVLFFVLGIIASLLIPLPPLAICYFIQIPLMSVSKFFKNKRNITIIGGIVGVVFAFGFNFYYQRLMLDIANPEAMTSLATGALSEIGKVYPPASFCMIALSNPLSINAVFAIIAMALVCFALPILLILLMSKLYTKSLIGFNEVHLKKLTKDEIGLFFQKDLIKRNPFFSLLKREIDLVNREPMYLLNGPFIILLMPIIVIIMMAVQKENFANNPDFEVFIKLIRDGYGVAIAAASGIFLGTSTSLTCSSISRDAKCLPFIKSLPVKASTYFFAKLVHGLMFAVFGVLVGTGLIAFIMKFNFVQIVCSVFIALAFSFLINLLGLYLDTLNPRLNWDNAIAAMKQNPNTIIAIFGVMGILALSGVLVVQLKMNLTLLTICFGFVPFVIFVVLLIVYNKNSEKYLRKLEN